MQLLPFALVLVSIFTHAYWNYLIKSSQNKHIFTALSKLSEIIMYAPLAIYYLPNTHFTVEFSWLIAVAGTITFLNYYFLSCAYRDGELSLVYPLARSSIIFLPVMSYFLLDEKIGLVGTLAIACILAGTFTMHLESFDRRGLMSMGNSLVTKSTMYALLAALTVAGYTLWDKVSITKISAFSYFYAYTLLVCVFYNISTFLNFSSPQIRNEWRVNGTKIIQVGFFNSLTYLLVLTALATSKATFVGGLRQLSIVVAVGLGYKFLNEKLNLPKIIGIIISVIGGAMIYFAK